MDLPVWRELPQIISQRFALLSKTSLNKFQKAFFIADVQLRAFTGQRHTHKRGLHPWRWPKRTGRNAQHNFGIRIKLAERGQIAVLAPARLRGDSFSNFKLYHDVDGKNLPGVLE